MRAHRPKAGSSPSVRQLRHAILESLESRVLLSVTFAPADMNGPWSYAATNLHGSMTFDNVGAISSASLLDTDGVTTTPTGTYAINSDGTLSIVSPRANNTKSGGMNLTQDVIAVANPNGHSLSILISGRSAVFANADLNGTWTTAINGEAGDTNGTGTISFDSAGNVTGGSIPDGIETFAIIGGSYTLHADGTCDLTVIDRNHDLVQSTITLTGALNAAKDVFAFNPVDFNAPANKGTNLIVGVRSSGVYANADLSGTWVVANDSANGWLILDGAGQITSGTLVTNGVDASVTGTYSVNSAGLVTLNATITTSGVPRALTFHGAINAARNALAMNTDSSGGDNLNVLVASADHVNHAPNLTTIAPLETATSGKSFLIPFADLLAASNASDADSDTLHFQITSLGTGLLTVDGAAVTAGMLPLTISAGNILGWTAPIGASGSIAAFSVKAYDGQLTSAAVNVPVHTILPSVFSSTDVQGTWTVAGTSVEGIIDYDKGGNVTGGTILDATGVTSTPSGEYEITEAGLFTTGQSQSETGAMSATKDVLATSDPSAAGSLKVLVRSTGVVFSDADLNGAWAVGYNGDLPGSNGIGALTFNGFGSILSGNVTVGTAKGSKKLVIVGGTYSVDPLGEVNVGVVTSLGNGSTSTLTLTGALNSAKDMLALNPPDLQGAVANGDPRLVLLVRPSASTSLADVKGTWTLASDGTTATLVLDGAGHITSGTVSSAGHVSSISGSYSVSGNVLTVKTTTALPGAPATRVFTGALDASHSAILLNSVGSASTNNLTVLINSGNHDPALSSVQLFSTAIATKPFEITYADLLAHSNATDLDRNTLGFKITALGSGALALNGVPLTSLSLPAIVSIGDVLTWTPTVTSTGKINAFSIKAFDGTTTSPTAIPVMIKTVLQPTVAITATKAKASENNPTTGGAGIFTLTRTNGITTAPLEVFFTSGGSAGASDYQAFIGNQPVTSPITFPAGSTTLTIKVIPVDDLLAEGTRSLQYTLAPDSHYLLNGAKTQAVVSIADNEPTFSIVATKPKASELNGQTTGFGRFTITRTGSLANGVTVDYTIGGTAANTVDYGGNGQATLPSTIFFAPGSATATITINPVDDMDLEGTQTVILTLVQDTGPNTPTYFVNAAKATAIVSIANHILPAVVFGGAIKNTPFSISYLTLLNATNITSDEGPVSFTVTAIKSGTLKKNGVPVVLNSTSLAAGDVFTWTPALNATGTRAAFILTATDGVNVSTPITVSVTLT